MKRQRMCVEYYICPTCGWEFSIHRKPHKRKELGHKKWLYCCTCKEEKNFEKKDEYGGQRENDRVCRENVDD